MTSDVPVKQTPSTWLRPCSFKDSKNSITKCRLFLHLESTAPCQLCPPRTKDYAIGGHEICFENYVRQNYSTAGASEVLSKYKFLCPMHADFQAVQDREVLEQTTDQPTGNRKTVDSESNLKKVEEDGSTELKENKDGIANQDDDTDPAVSSESTVLLSVEVDLTKKDEKTPVSKGLITDEQTSVEVEEKSDESSNCVSTLKPALGLCSDESPNFVPTPEPTSGLCSQDKNQGYSVLPCFKTRSQSSETTSLTIAFRKEVETPDSNGEITDERRIAEKKKSDESQNFGPTLKPIPGLYAQDKNQVVKKESDSADVQPLNKSLVSLRSGNCLDDEIMNSYMKIILMQTKSSNIFILSTFFYTSFSKCESDDAKIKCVSKYFSSCSAELKLWLLFIPFFLTVEGDDGTNIGHWTLGVINTQKKCFEYYDHCFGDYDPKDFHPFVTMRSVIKTIVNGNNDLRKIFGLSNCVEDSVTTLWVEKYGTEEKIGRQTGSVDCGVFVCEDVLSILTDDCPKNTLNLLDIAAIRERMCAEIFINDELFRNQNKSCDNNYLDEFRSLPQAGNTCHFTAACLSLCSHIVKIPHIKGFLEDENQDFSISKLPGVTSMQMVLKHLLFEGQCTPTNDAELKDSINVILGEIYGKARLNKQEDVGETFIDLKKFLVYLLKSRFFYQCVLPDVKIATKYHCDSHSQESQRVTTDFKIFTLYMPPDLETISLEKLIAIQQEENTTEWRCPENSSDDKLECKCSTFELIIGPPPPVVTFHIERNLPGSGNRMSTTDLRFPTTFSIDFYDPVQGKSEEYKMTKYQFIMESVVCHTAFDDQANSDEKSYHIQNPGHGHYITCMNMKDQDSTYNVYNDLLYPEVTKTSQEWISTHGRGIVLVTASLLSLLERPSKSEDVETFLTPILNSSKSDDCHTSDIESLSESEDSDDTSKRTRHLVSPPTKAISSVIALSENQKLELLSKNDTIESSLLFSFTDILFCQLKHFIFQNFKVTSIMKGFLNEDNDYVSREQELNRSPTVFMDKFGPSFLPILWKLSGSFIMFELVCDTSIPVDCLCLQILEKIRPNPEKEHDTCERAVVRTCRNHVDKDECGIVGKECTYVFHELLCNISDSDIHRFGELDWGNKYRKINHTDNATGIITSYWLGQTTKNNEAFSKRSNFLSVMTHSEVFYSQCVGKTTYIYQETDGNLDVYKCAYPTNMTPSDYKNLKAKWQAIDSESSQLTRRASISSVIECNLTTQYRLSQAVQSVIPVTNTSSFAYLTSGRRGALVMSLLFPGEVVGFERSQGVFEESVTLVEKLNVGTIQNHSIRSRIHLVNDNYSCIKSFNGFQGACMYIGNDKTNHREEYRNLVQKLFSSQSLMFFWCAKLNRTVFDKLVTGPENKKWYVKILKQCQQESNQHNFYIWYKKCKYWPGNMNPESIKEPDSQILSWIQKAKNSIFKSEVLCSPQDKLSNSTVKNGDLNIMKPKGLDFQSPQLRPKRNKATPVTPITPLVPLENSTKKERKPKNTPIEPKNTPIGKSNKRKTAKTDLLHKNSSSLKSKSKKFSGLAFPEQESSNFDNDSNFQHSEVEDGNIYRDSDRSSTSSKSIGNNRSSFSNRDASSQSEENLYRLDNINNTERSQNDKTVLTELISETLKGFGFNSGGKIKTPVMELQQLLSESLTKSVNEAFQKHTVEIKENTILTQLEKTTSEMEKTVSNGISKMASDLKTRDAESNKDFFKSAFEAVAKVNSSSLNTNFDMFAAIDRYADKRMLRDTSRSRSRVRIAKRPNRSRSESRSRRKHHKRTRHSRSSSRSRRRYRRDYGQSSRSCSQSRSRSREHKQPQHSRRNGKDKKKCRRSKSRSGSPIRQRRRSYSRISSPSRSKSNMSMVLPSHKKVADWNVAQVGMFLSSKNFPESVITAFRESNVHGLILPSINNDQIETIRVSSTGVEKYQKNQNYAIIDVIKSLLQRS